MAPEAEREVEHASQVPRARIIYPHSVDPL